MGSLQDEFRSLQTSIDLAEAGATLARRSPDAAALAALLAELNLQAEGLGRAAEGRTDLLYAGLKKGGPIHESGSVSFPSFTHRALLASAWTEGFLTGLMASGRPLSRRYGFLQIIEGGKSLDALSGERGPEEAASSLGLDLLATFSYAQRHAERILGPARDGHSDYRPLDPNEARDPALDEQAASFMMDGIFCGLMIRRLDQDSAGGPKGDIPNSEL